MTLEEYAKQVAAHIGGIQFEKMVDRRTALLVGNGEQGIYLTSDTYDFDVETSRLEISGRYPRHDGYTYLFNEVAPRPTAAARRGPFAIAKDIKRKFLTPYLEIYRKGDEAIKKQIAAEAQQRETIRELADILGVEAGRERLYPNFEGHGYVQVNVGGYVEFHLRSVPYDLAVKIAKLIRGEP